MRRQWFSKLVALLVFAILAAPGQAQLQDHFSPAPRAVPTVGGSLQLGKCVNLSNMFDAPTEAQWGRWPVEADIERIADKGFTAIRLPVRFSAHAMERAPFAVDPAFMERVASVVDLATRKGLAVIVDFHHYNELFEDPEDHAERFAVIWLQIAERFKNAPPNVSFELINEPHKNLDASNLVEVVSPALAAIRHSNPTRSVIWNGVEWAGLDELAESPMPQDDPHLVPTFHYYSPVNFGFDEADWLDPPSKDEFGSAEDLAEIEADLATARAYIEATGRVPFVGEFGAHVVRPQGERDEYYETLSEAFASIGIDSCAWGYANTFELYDDEQGWLGEAAAKIAAPLAPEPPEGSPVAKHGKLSILGNRIVGEHGEPVTLRGMSLFWSQWAPQYYTGETIDWLVKDWKITAVRAAIAAEGNDSARQHFEREFAKASRVIDAAVRNGIYVIVDWHAHRSYPDQAEEFLTAIARRYGHLPNLIYEPFNEPLRDDVDWTRDVKPYHERVVGAIRAIDPDNLVIVGSPSWSQDVDIAAQDPLAFANIGYTLHYYAATHKQDLRDKGQAALDAGLALLITEFGVVEATGNGPIDHESSQAWWDWAEANNIGWLAWSTGDRDETSATLKPGTPPAGWSEDDLTESGKLL
ncbi:MAG TPA: glycoside hydrolase family 5 protein, partial [Sphingomonadaceae bacterium]|nr:glycoside hydrolase family 5 protein [Sphingomonadaceae bacterium]